MSEISVKDAKELSSVTGRDEAIEVIVRLQEERDALLAVLKNFEIRGFDADGYAWLILHGQGITGKAMFCLGKYDRLVTRVAQELERDRRAAIAKATGSAA